jgi:hypothetical protein
MFQIHRFNEKIYIFFWFWFLFVGFLSVLSLLYWAFASLLPGRQRAYVAKYLRCSGIISEYEYTSVRDQRLIDDFIRRYMRTDGVFLLRMIQA